MNKAFHSESSSSTPTFPPKQNSFIPPLKLLVWWKAYRYYATREVLRKSAAVCRTGSMLASTAMPLADSVGGEETSLSGVDVTGSQSTQTRKTTRS